MIEINELSSRVNVQDTNTWMSQRDYIRQIVIDAIQEFLRHEQQVASERRITSGVRDEQEGET